MMNAVVAGNIVVACCMRRSMLTVECHKTYSIHSTTQLSTGCLKQGRSEVTVAAAAFLVIRNGRKKQKRKHRWWKRDIFIGNARSHDDLLGMLVTNDQSLFTNFSRMSLEDFNLLLEKVGPRIMKSDTNCREAIPPKIRLLVTLRFLATGDSYQSLMYLFKISQPSISRIII